MKRTILFNSDLYSLVSYGNGTAYALHDNVGKRSLFVQGGDALEIQSEIESYERIDPEMPYDKIYQAICEEYSAVMRADCAQ